MNNDWLIFSIGPACRPAYYLEATGIRTCAYPFDYIGTSLKIIYDLFKSDFKIFLNSYEDISNEWHIPGLKNIKDNNGIVIPHHIREDKDLKVEISNFKKLMNKRYKRLKEHILSHNRILMITNQSENINDLKDFLKAISDLFPNKIIVLLNVRNSNEEFLRKEFIVNKNLKIVEYYFKDIHINGENPVKNPHSWIGNEAKWLEITNDLKKGKI